jgi:hypothetical protein
MIAFLIQEYTLLANAVTVGLLTSIPVYVLIQRKTKNYEFIKQNLKKKKKKFLPKKKKKPRKSKINNFLINISFH